MHITRDSTFVSAISNLRNYRPPIFNFISRKISLCEPSVSENLSHILDVKTRTRCCWWYFHCRGITCRHQAKLLVVTLSTLGTRVSIVFQSCWVLRVADRTMWTQLAELMNGRNYICPVSRVGNPTVEKLTAISQRDENASFRDLFPRTVYRLQGKYNAGKNINLFSNFYDWKYFYIFFSLKNAIWCIFHLVEIGVRANVHESLRRTRVSLFSIEIPVKRWETENEHFLYEK